MNGKAMRAVWVLLVLLVISPSGWGDDYSQRRAAVQKRDARQRRVPVIPPKEQKLRVIIDTDARNEIDDVWALGLAVLCRERFQIEGFVAANYDNENFGGGPASIETSARTVDTVLEKAGLTEKFPVKRGSPPMRYAFEPSESEGVDFIIEKAMASTPEDPLWVIGLGAATDIASAYLKEPRIAERVVVFWHFRTEWPKRCWNFNVIGDVRAARIVFHSDLSFVLFDTGTYLTCPMEQSARWVDYSPLGRYLHEFRLENKWYQSSTKGFYDLGDIAALVEPGLATWEVVDCPEVNWDLAYQFKGTKGKILRCGAIDRDRTFGVLEGKLARKSLDDEKEKNSTEAQTKHQKPTGISENTHAEKQTLEWLIGKWKVIQITNEVQCSPLLKRIKALSVYPYINFAQRFTNREVRLPAQLLEIGSDGVLTVSPESEPMCLFLDLSKGATDKGFIEAGFGQVWRFCYSYIHLNGKDQLVFEKQYGGKCTLTFQKESIDPGKPVKSSYWLPFEDSDKHESEYRRRNGLIK